MKGPFAGTLGPISSHSIRAALYCPRERHDCLPYLWSRAPTTRTHKHDEVRPALLHSTRTAVSCDLERHYCLPVGGRAARLAGLANHARAPGCVAEVVTDTQISEARFADEIIWYPETVQYSTVRRIAQIDDKRTFHHQGPPSPSAAH